MKISKIALLVALAFGLTSNIVIAQSAGDKSGASPTARQQLKMDREEFLKTHMWDLQTEQWVMKPETSPPKGVKTRDELRAEREAFIKANRYNTTTERWEPLPTGEKSTLTREQVRANTKAGNENYNKTHVWDPATQTMVAKPAKK